MNKPSDKVLARIRKMLALAEGQADPNESAVAAGMAQKMMAKYNLEHADVMLNTLTEDDLVEHDVEEHIQRKIPDWMGLLIVPIARLHDCQARYVHVYKTVRSGARKPHMVVQFLGQREDAQVAAWVFSYLVEEIQRLAKTYRKTYQPERSQMTDFRNGCSAAIRDTLKRLIDEKDAEFAQSSSGTALVECKSALVAQKYGGDWVNRQRTTQRQNQHAANGYAQGSNVSIRKGVGNNAEKRTRIA